MSERMARRPKARAGSRSMSCRVVDRRLGGPDICITFVSGAPSLTETSVPVHALVLTGRTY